MLTTEQAHDAPTKSFGIEHEVSNRQNNEIVQAKSGHFPRLERVAGHEWSIALLYLSFDILCWVFIYGTVTFLRRDVLYTEPFLFFVIDLIQLGILVQALYIIGGYDRHVEKRSLSYTAEHILAIGAAAALSVLLIYSVAAFDQTTKPGRAAPLLSFAIFLPLSIFYRRSIQKYVEASFASRAFLVVGGGETAKRLYESYKSSPNPQQIHFVDVGNEHVGLPIAGEGSPIVEGDLAGKLRNLSQSYSGIILAEPLKSLSTEFLERLVRTQFQQTRVYTLESFYETHWRYVPLDAIDPVWPLQTGFQLARISPYHYMKRLFDVTVSSALLVISSPLFALLACLIRLIDGKPVTFRQARVGREGKQFTVFKFRTMRLNAEEGSQDIYTRKDDPRVTRLGRWLRKLRFDELPQLWNVWKGQMSLIGPRAEWIKCAERYEKKIPFYHFRHLVKPGITGWAQVNYPYGESDEDAIEKLQDHLYYIRHYSLMLDAMIVLKTVHTMLFGKGR